MPVCLFVNLIVAICGFRWIVDGLGRFVCLRHEMRVVSVVADQALHRIMWFGFDVFVFPIGGGLMSSCAALFVVPFFVFCRHKSIESKSTDAFSFCSATSSVWIAARRQS